MSEFLGSRISLISKSDIRYVGTLHEINSEESTVSLENVRSFGTEGRKGKPDEEIPASDQVYEYIVFRGSDVKDLRIEDHPSIKENKPPIPDDPAIVGARGRAPPPGPGPNQNTQPPPGPGQFPPGQSPNNFYGGAPPPGQGQWGRGGPGPMGGPPHGPPQFGNMPYPPPPGWYPPGQGFPQGGPGGPGQWQNQPPFPQGGPRNGPPPQPAGNNKPQPGAGQPTTESKQAARQPVEAPTPPVESKPSAEAVKAAAKGASDAGKAAPVDNRVKPVMPLPAGRAAPNSVQDATNAARAAVAVAMAQLGNPAPNPMDNLTSKVNEMRVNAGRGGHAGRGRGRGGRPPVGKVEVPDSDFDFAQSNAKFNKDEIVKEADGQGGAAAEEADAPEQAADAPPPVYNKASSFFDNISSEAKDRAETGGQRPGGREWRGEEQRKNMETFGQGSVDGGYRNYRGRGRGGRGRGYNRGGRGGGRPQYQTTEL